MYFQDLSPYEYGGDRSAPDVVNVGWLSREHPYDSGAVPREFVEAVRKMVASPVNLYRGTHLCEFCPEAPTTTTRGGLQMFDPPPGTTGNGEIRVCGSDGVTYVAPVLVLHYLEAHQYRPPESFIRAVLEVT
jgi:hypothetical protein